MVLKPCTDMRIWYLVGAIPTLAEDLSGLFQIVVIIKAFIILIQVYSYNTKKNTITDNKVDITYTAMPKNIHILYEQFGSLLFSYT